MLCECGCGEDAGVYSQTHPERDQEKGQEKPFVRGHESRGKKIERDKQTQCKRGHFKTLKNTMLHGQCRICFNENQKERTKTYLTNLRAKGICLGCKNPVDRDGVYCTLCCIVHTNRNARIKAEVLAHYGNKCVCCGESNPVFLCMDHIDGKGAEHRNEIYPQRPWGGRGNGATGVAIHGWIKKHKYPDIFQILCFNCNSAKHILGVCPHQQEKGSECHNQNIYSEPNLQDLILTESENKSQIELYSFAVGTGA